MKRFILIFIFINPSITFAATVAVVNNLNFGTIIPHPSGQAIRIDASSGPSVPVLYSGASSIISGGISGRIRFLPDMAGQIVRIFYPVSLTLTSGGNSMVINNFASNSTNSFRTSSSSPVDFYIGGILHISTGQPGGNYTGNMTININVTNP